MEEVLNISEFSWKEFQRLVGMIPQTDPTTSSYGTLLESIERYSAAYKFIDWVLSLSANPPEEEPAPDNIIPFNPPVAEEEKFEDPAPVEEPAVDDGEKYEAAVVRKAIQDARMQGKLASAKSWIMENWGVDGFNAIPAAKYGEVMDKLKELA